jgi:glycosyltransferase involved in cell wall biosynthesis
VSSPRVSILIPACNAEPWIRETLQSAAAQTWANIEIIVVDDGSRDQTVEAARSVVSDRITVVTQPNRGAAAARNHAFDLSRGDYIQWLDADDLLAADKIERQVELTARGTGPRTLLSGAWGSFGYRLSKTRMNPSALWADLAPAEWLFRKLEGNLYMMNASWLVSRELSLAAGPWDSHLSLDDDGEYFCRVLLASDGVKFTPGARAYYRRSTFTSLSNVDQSDKKLESLITSLERHIQGLLSLEDSPRTRSACLKYLQRWLPHFLPERPDLVRQLEATAMTLGGRLEAPRLRGKYEWLRPLLGWRRTKRLQSLMPRIKHSVLRNIDRALCRVERLRRPNA